MSHATRLANHIERTVTGPMWHGPALTDVLAGVTRDQALARPLSGTHSIWEIVLHVIAWCDIARLRLKGQATQDPTPEQDWPSVTWPASGSDLQFRSDPATDPGSDWAATVARLGDSHRQLAAAARMLTDAQLDVKVAGLEYPVGIMLSGVVEHGTYHGGQIALLKKR